MVYVLQMPLVILSCISHLAIALLAPTQIPSISSASFLCLNDKMQEASTRLHTKSRLRPESLCDPSRAKKHQDHSGTEPRRSQGVFFRTWGGVQRFVQLGLGPAGPCTLRNLPSAPGLNPEALQGELSILGGCYRLQGGYFDGFRTLSQK